MMALRVRGITDARVTGTVRHYALNAQHDALLIVLVDANHDARPVSRKPYIKRFYAHEVEPIGWREITNGLNVGEGS